MALALYALWFQQEPEGIGIPPTHAHVKGAWEY